MSDLEDIVAKARAAVGRKIKTADMLRILEEREAIIERLLRKIALMQLDNCALAAGNEALTAEVQAAANMAQRLAQRQMETT